MTHRRGTILMAVLVVVSIGTLIGTGVLLNVDAERAGADASRRRDQARALAWSGVQAAMAEVAAGREELLAGLRPELTDTWTLFEDDLGRQGVVRLIDLTPEDDGHAASEAGKLDINHATEEMLSKVPMLGAGLAKRIVEAREGRPFSSVEELLRVKGITADLLYGPAIQENAPSRSEEEAFAVVGAFDVPLEGQERLIDMLTVFSFDPNVIGGVGELSESRGRARLNLNLPWSDRLGRAIDKVWSEGASEGVKAVMDQGVTFKDDQDIVSICRRLGVEPEMWDEILDSFCTTDDQYRLGRVDIMNASAEVLACVPGISPDAAQRIVDTRDSLSEEVRLTPVWLVDREILEADDFEKAIDWITVRTLQWRIRIEAGLTLAEDAEAELDATRLGEVELTDRVTLDVVIDVSSQRPRIAYWRDVTLLEASRRLASRVEEVGESLVYDLEPLEEDPSDVALDEPAADEDDPSENPRGGRPSRPPTSPGRETDREPADRSGETAPPDDEAADADESDRSDGAEAGDDELPQVDRRIGRWTTSQGRRP